MEYSLGDLADRLSILRLKIERIEPPDPFQAEHRAVAWAYANLAIAKNVVARADELLAELYEVNGTIWNLESDIRMGKEGQLGLEEVGRRAILIRDTNERRVRLKNELNRISGTGFQESKSTFRV